MYCRYSGENSQRCLEEFKTRRTEPYQQTGLVQERREREGEKGTEDRGSKGDQERPSGEKAKRAKRVDREPRNRIAELSIGLRNWEKGSRAGESGAGWEVLRGSSGSVSLAASELWNASRHCS